MRIGLAALSLTLSACTLPQVQTTEQNPSQGGSTTTLPAAEASPNGENPAAAIEKDAGSGSTAVHLSAQAYVDAVAADLAAKGVSPTDAAPIAAAGHAAIDASGGGASFPEKTIPALALAEPTEPSQTPAAMPASPTDAGSSDAPPSNDPGMASSGPVAPAEADPSALIAEALNKMVFASLTSPDFAKLVTASALSLALEPNVALTSDAALSSVFTALSGKGSPDDTQKAGIAAAARAFSEFRARPNFEADRLVAAQHELLVAAGAANAEFVGVVLSSAPAVLADHLADAAAKAAYVDAAAADFLMVLGNSGDAKLVAAFVTAAAAIDAAAATKSVENFEKNLTPAEVNELKELLAADADASPAAPSTTLPGALVGEHPGNVIFGFNGNGTCPDLDPNLPVAARIEHFTATDLYREITAAAALKHADAWFVSCYTLLGQGFYMTSIAPNALRSGNPVTAAGVMMMSVAGDPDLKPGISVYLYGYSYGGADALAASKNIADHVPAAHVMGLVTVDPISHDCNFVTFTSPACSQFPAAFRDADSLVQVPDRVNYWQGLAQYLHSGKSTTDGAKDERIANADLPAGLYEAHAALQDRRDFFDRFRTMLGVEAALE